MPDFYVYVHRRKTDGRVFYVGKGCGNRAWAKRRNPFWQNVVAKHGLIIEIVEHGYQEWYALEREIELIAKFGKDNLCNLTDGGEGAWGLKYVGKKRTQATKDKMALAKLGRPRSQLAKDRIRETALRVPRYNAKQIVCLETGEIFPSATGAARWLQSIGIVKASQAGLSSCAHKKLKHAYGYSWEWKDTR